MAADHPFALLPAVEDNQGLLTLFALGLALIAFLVENRRANEAEAHGRAEARRAELAAIERALEAERKDSARTRQLELARMHRFVEVVSVLICEALDAVNEGIRLSSSGGPFRFPSNLKDTLLEVTGSLAALLPAAPLDPDLMLSAQRAANITQAMAFLEHQDWMIANQRLNAAKETLTSITAQMDAAATACATAVDGGGGA